MKSPPAQARLAVMEDRVKYQSAQSDLKKRFLILFALLVAGSAVLLVRLATLTVVQGTRLAQAAEERLDVVTFLPTWRGTLFDRKGRVLARDVASYDLAVSYPLAKREWALDRAREAAKVEAGTAWKKMTPATREERTALKLSHWREQQEQLIQVLATHAGASKAEFEESLDEIARRIDAQAAEVYRRQLASRRERGQSLDVKAEPIREMREMHVVTRDISTELAFELRKLSDISPGAIEVVDAARRVGALATDEVTVPREHMPRAIRTSIPLRLTLDGALDQLVGSVRNEAWKEDLARRPFDRVGEDGMIEIDLGGYRAGRENVGSRGMERRFEDQLRGSRGQSIRRLDSPQIDRVEPIPGTDVTLSIDAKLQLAVQAALDPRTGLTQVQPWHTHSEALPVGEPLPAAAVIVDVATGEVIAAASTPLPQDAQRGGRASMAIESASINRALDAAYPPGSLVKPFVYLAAVAEGVASEDEAIECNGHFFKDRTDAARCWIYRPGNKIRTHREKTGGPLVIEDALARSCNIYFYTLANRLGASRLCEWYRRFGLGMHGGQIPTAEEAALIDARPDRLPTVSLGIGQGRMAITPLEMANAYAMLARGGSVRSPSFSIGGNPVSNVFPFSPTAVSHALDGLRRVVSELYGTGHRMDYPDGASDSIIDAPGVRVWAKTGTAEAPALKIDRDHDGVAERTVTDADHAWCAALVASSSEKTPRYSIAVIVEHGGGGGRAAGPVMAAVIRALMSEGYFESGGSAVVGQNTSAGAVR